MRHALIIIILDQAAKSLASTNLELHQTFPIFKDIFHFTLVHNTGAAFGFFKGMYHFIIFLSVVTIFLIVLYANKFRYGYKRLRIGLLFILAGTIGNLIDRLNCGYVVDFIDLRIWPVFNIADMAITIGGAFLVYHILIFKKAASPKPE
jgi:signal peptidase II